MTINDPVRQPRMAIDTVVHANDGWCAVNAHNRTELLTFRNPDTGNGVLAVETWFPYEIFGIILDPTSPEQNLNDIRVAFASPDNTAIIRSIAPMNLRTPDRIIAFPQGLTPRRVIPHAREDYALICVAGDNGHYLVTASGASRIAYPGHENLFGCSWTVRRSFTGTAGRFVRLELTNLAESTEPAKQHAIPVSATSCVADLSADGELVLITSGCETMLWTRETNPWVAESTGEVLGAVFLPGSSGVLVLSQDGDDGRLSCRNIDTGKDTAEKRLRLFQDLLVRPSLSVSPDGKRLLIREAHDIVSVALT